MITIYSSFGVSRPTVLGQSRTSRVINGVPTYLVINTIQKAGALPDASVFLVEIVDPSNTELDSLARIVDVPDFYEYPNSRERALELDLTFYRTSNWTQQYVDLNEAVIGANLFKSGVDGIARSWHTYISQFRINPPGELSYYPQTDASVIDALVSNWIAANTTLTNAVNAKTVADVTYNVAKNNYDILANLKQIFETARIPIDRLVEQKAQFDSLVDAIGTSNVLIGDKPTLFPGGLNTGSGFWESLNNLVYAIDNFTAPSTLMAANRSIFLNETAGGISLLIRVTDLLRGVTTTSMAAQKPIDMTHVHALYSALDAQLETALTTMQQSDKSRVIAASAVDAATISEKAALSAVLAACPEFDKTNPLDYKNK